MAKANKIEYLVIHCTATQEGRAVTKHDIEEWHLRGRGWDRVGYSDMIHLNGVIENLTPYNDNDLVESHEITWGATGINSISRHVVYVGGIDKKLKPKDTRTGEQLAAMERYVKQVLKKYPSIKIAGHNQFAAKACPSFDVPKWGKSIGISDKNIKK